MCNTHPYLSTCMFMYPTPTFLFLFFLAASCLAAFLSPFTFVPFSLLSPLPYALPLLPKPTPTSFVLMSISTSIGVSSTPAYSRIFKVKPTYASNYSETPATKSTTTRLSFSSCLSHTCVTYLSFSSASIATPSS